MKQIIGRRLSYSTVCLNAVCESISILNVYQNDRDASFGFLWVEKGEENDWKNEWIVSKSSHFEVSPTPSTNAL